MEEAPENGKESSHSAHANGMNELLHTVHSFRAPQELVTILLIPQKLSWLLATDGRKNESTEMLWSLVTYCSNQVLPKLIH